jgi:hypothetical protein
MYQNHRIDPLPTMYDLPSEDKEEIVLKGFRWRFPPALAPHVMNFMTFSRNCCGKLVSPWSMTFL